MKLAWSRTHARTIQMQQRGAGAWARSSTGCAMRGQPSMRSAPSATGRYLRDHAEAKWQGGRAQRSLGHIRRLHSSGTCTQVCTRFVNGRTHMRPASCTRVPTNTHPPLQGDPCLKGDAHGCPNSSVGIDVQTKQHIDVCRHPASQQRCRHAFFCSWHLVHVAIRASNSCGTPHWAAGSAHSHVGQLAADGRHACHQCLQVDPLGKR